MSLEEQLEKLYPKEARLKNAQEISENYHRLQMVKEKMIELCAKKFIDIEARHTDIREIAMAIAELTDILKDLEMNRIIAEKDIEILLKS